MTDRPQVIPCHCDYADDGSLNERDPDCPLHGDTGRQERFDSCRVCARGGPCPLHDEGIRSQDDFEARPTTYPPDHDHYPWAMRCAFCGHAVTTSYVAAEYHGQPFACRAECRGALDERARIAADLPPCANLRMGWPACDSTTEHVCTPCQYRRIVLKGALPEGDFGND